MEDMRGVMEVAAEQDVGPKGSFVLLLSVLPADDANCRSS